MGDGIAMTRRVAVGGGVLAGVTAFAMPGGSAQTGAGAAPVSAALLSRLQGTLSGADLEKLTELMHPAVRTIAWTGSVELDVLGPAAYRDSYLTPYLRDNPEFAMTISKVLSNGIELVALYDVSAVVDGKKSVWCGCNVYLTDGERITEQWIQQDLWWRSRASPTVNSRLVIEHLDRHFRTQTTAANLAAMGRLVSDKNTATLSPQRIWHLIDLLAPDAVQTTWDVEGIKFLPDPRAISLNFEQHVLSVIQNFWETIRRVVIIGNMAAFMQVPSGNLILPDSRKKFCAWYNCDLFFFDAEKIRYLIFQRDIIYDRSQTLI